jgi:hypothetical protein
MPPQRYARPTRRMYESGHTFAFVCSCAEYIIPDLTMLLQHAILRRVANECQCWRRHLRRHIAAPNEPKMRFDKCLSKCYTNARCNRRCLTQYYCGRHNNLNGLGFSSANRAGREARDVARCSPRQLRRTPGFLFAQGGRTRLRLRQLYLHN